MASAEDEQAASMAIVMSAGTAAAPEAVLPLTRVRSARGGVIGGVVTGEERLALQSAQMNVLTRMRPVDVRHLPGEGARPVGECHEEGAKPLGDSARNDGKIELLGPTRAETVLVGLGVGAMVGSATLALPLSDFVLLVLFFVSIMTGFCVGVLSAAVRERRGGAERRKRRKVIAAAAAGSAPNRLLGDEAV
jgi:hypothetical protein